MVSSSGSAAQPGASSSRGYHSELRAAQARATRRVIVAAAHDLFVDQGYASVTIDAVAKRAGVSRKTVFNAVGGKGLLLKLALDWALAGDDEPVALADRPEVRAEMALTDPLQLIASWSRRQAVIESRAARLALVMSAAADSDPEAARVHENSERGRMGAAHSLADRLQRLGALRPGLEVETATVIAGALTEPLLFVRLVVDAGWPIDDYRAWLERMLRAALLPEGAQYA